MNIENLQNAIKKAIILAKKHNNDFYIIKDYSYEKSPFYPYIVCKAESIATFFIDCPIVAIAYNDGIWED